MQDPVYERVANTPRPTLSAAGAMVLVTTAGLWLTSLLAWKLALTGDGEGLVNLMFYVPFVLLPIAIYAARRPGIGASLRLNPMPPLSTLTVALLALMSVYAASGFTLAWQWLLGRLGLTPHPVPEGPDSQRALILGVIAMAAVPAVCEELLFRGFVLSAWESRGTWFAAGLATVMFALLHGNLYAWPAYLLVGGLAAYLVVRLDSLYAGITFHTVYNTACLVIPYLARSRGTGDAEAAVTGSELAGIGLELALVLLVMAMLLYPLRARSRTMGIEPIPRIRRPLSLAERLWTGAALAALAVTTLVMV